MATTPRGDETGTTHWDRLYEALSAQSRRVIIFSLMNEPEERRLPLPDAAQSSADPRDPEKLRVQLHHKHLPMLADAGYVRWESDPFCVQRGPHFEEPALVLTEVVESSRDYPQRLRSECAATGGV